MTSYLRPSVQIQQAFEQVPGVVVAPLTAFIFGENYQLLRYAVAEEKALIGLGSYAPGITTNYQWPNRLAGSIVDESYAKLYLDAAWLRYFLDVVGAGHEFKAVDGFPNRITSPTFVFATANGTDRSSDLEERDVAVGDGVKLSALAPNVFEQYSEVSGLIPDVIPAVIDSPITDVGNAPASSLSAVVSQESGTTGTVGLASDATLYDGSDEGKTTETYFLEVTVGGVFGAAQLKVTSASGTDDQVDPFVPLDGITDGIGSRGLTATFTSSGSGTPFEVGQIFKVIATQAWTQAVPSIDGGSFYSGDNSGTYVITVTQGGKWATTPRVFVSSTGELDNSGPYLLTDGVFFTLPTGLKIILGGGDGLVKDDKYYVDVTAELDGAIHTIELKNSLPDEAFGGTGSAAVIPDLNLNLHIIAGQKLPQTDPNFNINWETGPLEVTVHDGIMSTDASWVDAAGKLLLMPIVKGEQFLEYRYTRTAYLNSVGSLGETTSIGDIEDLLGTVDQDNPLAFGVFKALQTSGGTAITFMATVDGSLAAYLTVLSAIFGRRDVWGLVPLTHDKEIQDAVVGHVLAQSTQERNRWSTAWFGATLDLVSPILTLASESNGGGILKATILDDPDISGTQFTRARSNEADFITNGVLAGYEFRTNYLVDPTTGEEHFDTYIIDFVLTEEEVRLVGGPSLAITIPSRFEIHRVNSSANLVTQLQSQAALSERRVRLIFPDKLSNGGSEVDSMFVACSLAGLRSGVFQHQGLTNSTLVGYDDASRAAELFSDAELDQIAGAGIWIVTEDEGGNIISRHQLTTDMSDVNSREDSLVANLDAISRTYLSFFVDSGYIGLRNITDGLLAQIDVDFGSLTSAINLATDVGNLGPAIISATLTKLERHPTLLDHIVADVDLDLPEPLNNLSIKLTVLAQ